MVTGYCLLKGNLANADWFFVYKGFDTDERVLVNRKVGYQ